MKLFIQDQHHICVVTAKRECDTIPEVQSNHEDSAGLAALFLATVFSLNPFLNRLDTVFRYRILPVPVVFLRLAFWPHSYERNLALG